ncbi:uncharacterized protein [Diadema antillarum]|uniref:uncharacterized protein n=1 Tax=Diadema antillarum TaxID=105358 RepID=UPI003A847F44
MFSRTPLLPLPNPSLDKENVTVFTPRSSAKRGTPLRALDTQVLTPSRPPLAPVNGDGSGLRSQQLRRLSLKPSLPRIEALRKEDGVYGRTDSGCTPRGSKSARKARRSKSRSCLTTPTVKSAEPRRKPADSVVDSITSHLFDKLIGDELGTHNKSSVAKLIPSRRIATQTPKTPPSISPPSSNGLATGEKAREECFSRHVSSYVQGIISSTAENLEREARVETLWSQLQHSSNRPNRPSTLQREPTDEDIGVFVDAILSVQLQIVRKEFEEKLNVCLETPVEDISVQSSALEYLDESGAGSATSIGSLMSSFGDAPDESLGASPLLRSVGHTSASHRSSLLLVANMTPCSLLDSISSPDTETTSFGESPGYMLLPPRREATNQVSPLKLVTIRNESTSSESSYEDEFLRFVHQQFNGFDRDIDTPSMQDAAVGTPLKLTESSSNTSPAVLSHAQTGMSPGKVANMETCMTPIRHSDLMTETSPIPTMDCGTDMETIATRDAMIGTPIKTGSIATGVTPVRSSSVETNTSLVNTVESSTEMGIELTDSGTDAYRPEQSDAMVGTPVKVSSAGVATSPVPVHHAASYMTPVRVQDAQIGTPPPKTCDAGTTMPVLDFTDAGVGTEARECIETAVGTTPKSSVDREVGSTPLQMVDTTCGTTPHQFTDGSTVMTPVLLSSTQTLTSPPVVPSLRFSSSPSSLDSSKLVSHVQTAAISNQLLRTEIQLLKSQKDEAEERLVATRRQMEKKEQEVAEEEERMGHLRRTARASADREIEDLMGQVGEQMMQIGQLEATLAEKNEAIHSLKADQQKLRKDYDHQISDLQDDLCRAYRQHQQQITELETQYRKEDCERHYARSQRRVQELEGQVTAFTQLQDTVDRALQVQADFDVVKETFGQVHSLYQLTMEQQRGLKLQRAELQEEKSSLEGERKNTRQRLEEGERRVREMEEKMEGTMRQHQEWEGQKTLLLKDVSKATANIRELQERLDVNEQDLASKNQQLQDLSSHCSRLQEREVAHFLELQNQEAAMLAQLEQHKSVEAEFAGTKKKLGETINQLQKQCQSLSSEKLALEVDLKSNKAKLYSVQAELGDLKRAHEATCAKASEMESELNSCRNAKAVLASFQSKLQTLQTQYLESKQFMEEERLALEESAKEVESELRVTSLELSRSQGALCEAEHVRRQLQENLASLTNKMESLQSELDHTKAQAHWMLLNQGSEISNAATALAELNRQMAAAFSKVQDKPNIQQVLKASAKGFITERRRKRCDRQPKQTASTPAPSSSASLVVSVLRALEHKETPGRETINCASEQEVGPALMEEKEGRPTIGQSGSSAFQAVRPSLSQENHGDGVSGERDAEKEEEEEGEPSGSLLEQVQKLRAKFERMYGIFLEKEEELSVQVEELQLGITERDQRTKRTEQLTEERLRLLQRQLEESVSHRHRLQEELGEAQGGAGHLHQALDHARQRMECMAANLARFSDQKSTIESLEQRVSELTSSLHLVRQEKEMVMGQFEAMAGMQAGQASSASHGEGAGTAKVMRENIGLKNELEKLRMKFLKRQEDYETFRSKAGRQMKVLEGNWKKAESEIHRLDQVFEHCRKVMEKVPSSACQQDENLRLLWEIFGGGK